MEQLKSELRAKFEERSAAGINICAALLFKLKESLKLTMIIIESSGFNLQ